MMARTQLPNLALPRSPEDGLAGSGSAFDKQFRAGTQAVGIAGEGHQRKREAAVDGVAGSAGSGARAVSAS